MKLSRRSFSLLAASLVGASLLVTAASAHIIWVPYIPVPVDNPTINYSVTPGNTTYNSRRYYITISNKPSNVTVTGPAYIIVPGGQSTASATFSFTGGQVGQYFYMTHGDANNTWNNEVEFVD
jgi:hypothetical protein